MSFDILNRWTAVAAYHSEKATTAKEAAVEAVTNKAVLSRADLRGADLSRAVLSRADLSGADLSGADLSGADLSGADLSGAYLSGADLSGADLSGAYLSGADLSGAKVDGFEMRGEVTQFSCAEWGDGSFTAYIEKSDTLHVICGCRHFSYEEAVEHWKDRGDRKMTRVTLAMAKLWYDAIQEVPNA